MELERKLNLDLNFSLFSLFNYEWLKFHYSLQLCLLNFCIDNQVKVIIIHIFHINNML